MIKGENTFAFSFQQRVIFFIIKARQYPKKSHRGQVTTLYPHLLLIMMDEHTVEKSQINAPNVIMHPLRKVIWEAIWKPTVGKSSTNATNVTLHPLVHTFWGNIWKHTVDKSQTKIYKGFWTKGMYHYIKKSTILNLIKVIM